MIVVGLTGGIGSGKSTVKKILETLNVRVFESDKEAKLLLNTPDVMCQIGQVFGADIVKAGLVDRPALAALVFHNPDRLQQLNGIVHPALRLRFRQWLELQVNQEYVVNEAAILFESGLYRQVDYSINVNAPLDIRISRVVKRDKVTREAVEARVKNQMSDQERSSLASFNITNDGVEPLLPQVLQIDQVLRNKIK